MPRNLPARDEQRLQAAVARGALTPARAEHWRVYAAAGHSIEFIDQLAGGVVISAADTAAAPGRAGTVAAAAASRPVPQEPGDEAEYLKLFGSAERGQQIADARLLAARDAIAALTDDEVYERMFPGPSRRAAAAPVTASATGGAGQRAPRAAGQQLWRVHVPLVSVRVPNVAAGADQTQTSWRTIDLRAGDLVPANVHPEDLDRLRHQKTRLGGEFIKPW